MQNGVGKDNFRLCMIDTGIVAELSSDDRQNFLELFKAVIDNDGSTVGRLMVERSCSKTVSDRDGFMRGMQEVVSEVRENGLSLGRIGVASILHKVLLLCFNHHVKLDPKFASVIIALGVLEGLGRRLDPDVDIFPIAIPYIIGAIIQNTANMKTNG